jgi:mono/diheme cytochrome c family protein
MTTRARVLACLLSVSVPALADQGGDDGAALFKARCQACHTLGMVEALLEPRPKAERPAYLAKFLKTHPARLTAGDLETVIAFLSHKPD